MLVAVLHEVLVVQNDSDPLVEVVQSLTNAGMTDRRIAKTISVSENLVQYLRGIQGDEGPASWQPRQVVQDWATGRVWPSRDADIELLRADWTKDRESCLIRVGSHGRHRTLRLPMLVPPGERPNPPTSDDVAGALSVDGARLFGMSEVVGVRARLGRTGADVAVLAPFADIVDHRTTVLFNEQTARVRALHEIADDVMRTDARNSIVERSYEAFVLSVEASSSSERLSREQRQTIAQRGRRVMIAVAEEIARDVDQALPLGGVVLSAVQTGRWPRDRVPLAALEDVQALDRTGDRAAEAVGGAIASILASSQPGDTEDELGLWLFEALLRLQWVAGSGNLGPDEQRERVERLEELLERVVLTHIQREEERG